MKKFVTLLMQGLAFSISLTGGIVLIVILLPIINPYYFYRSLPQSASVDSMGLWYFMGFVIAFSMILLGYKLSQKK